jgi:hypothetical protein
VAVINFCWPTVIVALVGDSVTDATDGPAGCPEAVTLSPPQPLSTAATKPSIAMRMGPHIVASAPVG